MGELWKGMSAAEKYPHEEVYRANKKLYQLPYIDTISTIRFV
jgi:hypothetical protein